MIEPGAVLDEVVSGSMRLVVDGRSVVLRPGESFEVPAGASHRQLPGEGDRWNHAWAIARAREGLEPYARSLAAAATEDFAAAS